MRENMAMNATCTSRLRSWGVWVLCLCVCVLTACKSELFARLDEVDANAVMMVLYAEGINATKTPVDDKFWRIEVEENDQQRALQVTRNQGVPRERFANMGDLFKKDGLVSTPSEVRMRYIFALSQELSSTLSNIDGVISARVHPVIPVNDPLSDKVAPASAAVFIKHLPDADLQLMAPAIKTLIARSIEGLKVENVSLTFFPARPAIQIMAPAHGGLASVSDVSASTMLLAGCLALTWGAFGWVLWRKQSRRTRTQSSLVVSASPRPPPNSDGRAQAVAANGRVPDVFNVPAAAATAAADEPGAPRSDAPMSFNTAAVAKGKP